MRSKLTKDVLAARAHVAPRGRASETPFSVLLVRSCRVLSPVLVMAFVGCASQPSADRTTTYASPSTIVAQQASSEAVKAFPINPRNGDAVYGNIRIGMTVPEVLRALPNSKFDDQWSSQGVVGAMGESGFYATNKIKVTAEVPGPYKKEATLYVLFDDTNRCDGIVIFTARKSLPQEIVSDHGFLGFSLAEYKEAARKLIATNDLPEAGVRAGNPRLGLGPSVGTVTTGVAKTIGGVGVGLGFSSTVSPAVITQRYEKDGYISYLATAGVSSGYGKYLVWGVFNFAFAPNAAALGGVGDVE
jgi:hypothetical protein